MKPIYAYFGAGISLGASSAMLFLSPAAAAESEQTCCPGPRPMRATLQHIEGRGIGYGQGYTSLDLFLGKRLANDAHFSFLDLRGHVFDDGKFAANAGIGYRVLDAKRIWGANAYYDYRNASRLHYNQVGVGLESLGKTWDFRCNGYVPVGKNHSEWKHPKFDRFKGNEIYLHRNQKFALWGIDTEADAHCDKTKNWDLYGGGGPYYFGNHGKNAWGFKARASATYKQFVYLEASGSYDNIFNTIGQVEVGFSLPFGPRATPKKRACGYDDCGSLAVLEDRLVQPVLRQEIVVEAKRHRKELAIDPLTGLPYHVLFVDNTSHSLGTFESPYNTLADALAASSIGDILYIFPGDGTTTGLNAFGTPFQLLSGQQILGAGITHPLQTTVGSLLLAPQSEGMPHLTADNNFSVLFLSEADNTVSGLYFTASFDTGLVGPPGFSCIDSTGQLVNMTITSNRIEAENGVSGITLGSVGGMINIMNNTLSLGGFSGNTGNYGGTGITINGLGSGECLGQISGNILTSSLEGIFTASGGMPDVTVLANDIYPGAGISFSIGADATNFHITGNHIDSYASGILISGGGGSVDMTVAHNTISNIATSAIFSQLTADSQEMVVSIENNLIKNCGCLIGDIPPSGAAPMVFLGVSGTQGGSTTYNLISNVFDGFGADQDGVDGVLIQVQDGATLFSNVQGNQFSNATMHSFSLGSTPSAALRLEVGGTGDPCSGQFTVLSNTFVNTRGLAVAAHQSPSTAGCTLCLRFQDNQSTADAPFKFYPTSTSTFTLEPVIGNSPQPLFLSDGSFSYIQRGSCP